MVVGVVVADVIKIRFVIVLINSINEIHCFDEKLVFATNCREFENSPSLFIS